MTYFPDTASGVSIPGLADAGALALSDRDVINRAGSDFSTSMSSRITLMRKTPAGSRTVALPAVLTATDHDKNVILTGSTGALSVDGTVADGFRCVVINNAAGVASYSGIVGLLGTTSLASGYVSTVMMAGATVFASAEGGVSIGTATAYATTVSSNAGLTGSVVTMTFTPTGGAWPSGEVLTPAATGLAGTFSPTTITCPASTAAVTCTFMPSSAAGTSGTLGSTASPALTNATGSLSYSITNAPATSFSMTESASSGLIGSPVTLSFSPVGGNWPAGQTITLASTLTGSFSTLTISAGTATPATCTFTPSLTGTATISATNTNSATALVNPNSITYSVLATATAYTTALSATSGNTGAPVTLTFTPNGGWPNSGSITPTASGLAGTFSPTSVSMTSGSNGALTCTFTPSSAGTATFGSTSSPSLTNSTGNLTYAASVALATGFGMTLSSGSGVVNSPVTVTFAPTGGTWPASETITPTTTSLSGAFFPTTLAPTAGGSGSINCTFTPTAAGTGSINATASPALTNTSGAQTYTATPITYGVGYATPSGVTRVLTWDASVSSSVTGSGSSLVWTDQTSNVALAPVTGGSISSYPVPTANSQNALTGLVSNANGGNGGSTLRTSASQATGLQNGFTALFLVKALSTTTSNVLQLGSSTSSYLYIWMNASGSLYATKVSSGSSAGPGGANIVGGGAGTLAKVVVRYNASASLIDLWCNNSGKQTATVGTTLLTFDELMLFGNNPGSSKSDAIIYGLEFYTGTMADSDCVNLLAAATAKWGS